MKKPPTTPKPPVRSKKPGAKIVKKELASAGYRVPTPRKKGYGTRNEPSTS